MRIGWRWLRKWECGLRMRGSETGQGKGKNVEAETEREREENKNKDKDKDEDEERDNGKRWGNEKVVGGGGGGEQDGSPEWFRSNGDDDDDDAWDARAGGIFTSPLFFFFLFSFFLPVIERLRFSSRDVKKKKTYALDSLFFFSFLSFVRSVPRDPGHDIFSLRSLLARKAELKLIDCRDNEWHARAVTARDPLVLVPRGTNAISKPGAHEYTCLFVGSCRA